MLFHQLVRQFPIGLICATALLVTGYAEAAPTIVWTKQFGAGRFTYGNEVVADGIGGAYVAGGTQGDLYAPYAGSTDAFVSHYDSAGTFLWGNQFGLSKNDTSFALAVDSQGNALVAGRYNDDLVPRDGDAFVRKYTSSHSLAWSNVFGSSEIDVFGNPKGDYATGVSADATGNVYATGITDGSLDGPSVGAPDAFLRKFTTEGSLLWGRQLGGATHQYPQSIANDALGNVIVGGWTGGDYFGESLYPNDVFLAKYDPSGATLWSRQIGSAGSGQFDRNDTGGYVALDDLGNIFIAGNTTGNLAAVNAGLDDVFLQKHDPSGNLLWSRQLGTLQADRARGVAVTRDGDVYVAGYTEGELGTTNAGFSDAFVAKFNAQGSPLWNYQFGTSESDGATGIDVDDLGNVFLTGYTSGGLGGPLTGDSNAWAALMREQAVPEPSALTLALCGCIVAARIARCDIRQA